jgi:Family of unknown function (DUF6308)
MVLRGGLEVQNPLEVVIRFLEAYSVVEVAEPSASASFDERDLRRANRGGARISAAEIGAILERRRDIERALREIPPGASLTARTIPWLPLRRLFDGFADIRGVGFSKMTKALHPKRPALIPMLDRFVQEYLERADPPAGVSGPFGERAAALVLSYKVDLDRNRSALRGLRRELSARGYRVTEVRILDMLIWSLSTAA